MIVRLYENNICINNDNCNNNDNYNEFIQFWFYTSHAVKLILPVHYLSVLINYHMFLFEIKSSKSHAK